MRQDDSIGKVFKHKMKMGDSIQNCADGINRVGFNYRFGRSTKRIYFIVAVWVLFVPLSLKTSNFHLELVRSGHDATKDSKNSQTAHQQTFGTSLRCKDGSSLDESMATLTSALTTNTDYLALREIGPTSNVGNRRTVQQYFSGLDASILLKTLVGERAALIGDSTLRNLFFWLEKTMYLAEGVASPSPEVLDQGPFGTNPAGGWRLALSNKTT